MKKLPLLLLASAVLLAACGKKEETPAAAPAEQAAPAAEAPAAPAAPAESTAPAADAAAPAVAANEAGEKVFKGTCSMCHATGAAGAPIKGNKADWAPRIAQGKDVLYQHALNGFTGKKGMMPARGGNTSLKDEDVKAGVDYMVSQSQ